MTSDAKPMLDGRLRVLLLDAYCPSHVGNDVLFESSLRLVREAFPDADITVHAVNPTGFQKLHEGRLEGLSWGERLFSRPPRGGLRKLAWFFGELSFAMLQMINAATFSIAPYKLSWGKRRASLRDFCSADIAISIGGEMISDTFWKVLPLHLHMIWLSQRSGAKTVIFPQSVGPLRKWWSRGLVSLVFARCKVVTGRDRPAIDELRTLNIDNDKIVFSPDVGVGQPQVSDTDAHDFLGSLGLRPGEGKRLIGITCSAGSPEITTDPRQHLASLAEAIKILASQREVAVLILPANMPVEGTPDTDYRASAYVYELVQDSVETVLLEPQLVSAAMFKGVCKNLDLFVSTRMHAAILSSLAPVPTIAINTQRKLRGYMELIGQADMCLDVTEVSPAALLQLMEISLSNKQEKLEALNSAREERLAALADYALDLRVKLAQA